LKVLSIVRTGEPAGTRTQGPRLKMAIEGDRDRVRRSETVNDVSLKLCAILPERVRWSAIA